MLHEFLHQNRHELIARCRAKVARRPAPRPTPTEMEHGIPLFLGQLIDTLRTQQETGKRPLAAPGDETPSDGLPAVMEFAATRHGNELLRRGFTVDQVVHDYGDLCQAITELAVEKKAPVDASEFRTLNGCLDDAIADAVTEYGRQRDQLISDMGNRAMGERLGYLAHELRNCLNSAILSYAAIKDGRVGLHGATADVLDRSLLCLRDLIDRPFVDARLAAGKPPVLVHTPVEQFLADVQLTAGMDARVQGCEFSIAPVDPGLAVRVDRQLLFSALSNLLQNAFKFSRPGSHVGLRAYGAGDRVVIEVQDECGGLPEGVRNAISQPSVDGVGDYGVGQGLSIARRAIEAMDGALRAHCIAEAGCVFTIDLPAHNAPA
jgi:signal transduction histidine kinase